MASAYSEVRFDTRSAWKIVISFPFDPIFFSENFKNSSLSFEDCIPINLPQFSNSLGLRGVSVSRKMSSVNPCDT